MPLPQAVSALVAERLETVDAALPGFVTALWVTGSAASGDWRPDRSDVDFVAATTRVPALADAEALAALHASRGEPCYDGIYVAGAYAAERFPEYAELAGRCVRWRAGQPEQFTMADGLHAAALIRAVVSDAGSGQPSPRPDGCVTG